MIKHPNGVVETDSVPKRLNEKIWEVYWMWKVSRNKKILCWPKYATTRGHRMTLHKSGKWGKCPETGEEWHAGNLSTQFDLIWFWAFCFATLTLYHWTFIFQIFNNVTGHSMLQYYHIVFGVLDQNPLLAKKRHKQGASKSMQFHCFVAIYAFLRGEKFCKQLCMWRKIKNIR